VFRGLGNYDELNDKQKLLFDRISADQKKAAKESKTTKKNLKPALNIDDIDRDYSDTKAMLKRTVKQQHSPFN